jgi:hypothetical protein
MALDAASKPVSQKITGTVIEGTGKAMTAMGETVQEGLDWLKSKRAAALGSTDEAVEFGDAVAEKVTGISPSVAERTAQYVSDFGKNVSAAGRLMRTMESSTPYFQRLAKETDGWTRFTAQNANRVEFVSRIGRGIGESVDGAVKGGAYGAAIGFMQGDAAEGLGEGILGGFFGGNLRTISLERDPNVVRARQIGDIADSRSRRTRSQQQVFDSAPRNLQLAAATFEATNPNLTISFVNEKGGGGSYRVNPDGTGEVRIDLDSSIPLVPLLAHEVSHHISRNPDIASDLKRRFLGDEAAGQPGYFTEFKDGKLQPTEEFSKFRGEYLQKLRDAGKDTSVYEENPELILHEVIAEASVSSLLATNAAGEFAGIGALRKNMRPLAKLVDLFAKSPTVMNSSVLQRALMATGAVFTDSGAYAKGTGLFETDMSPKLRSAVGEMVKKYDRMNLDERGGQIESFSESPTTYSDKEIVANPELMDLVSSGFDVDYDPKTGKRTFLSASEAKKREQSFMDDLLLALEASPDLSPGRVRAELTRDGRTIYTGKYVPADVLEALASKNKHNPRQLEMLQMITEIFKKNPGNEAHFVYQPALTRESKVYKQRSVTNRVETPISIVISRTGGILINTLSQEKVLRNLEFFSRKGLLEPWSGDIRAARADVYKYAENTSMGRDGAEGLNQDKRDVLNALFGQLTKTQRERNPVLQGLSEKQARKIGVVQSRRLDRINQLKVLDSEFKTNYGRIAENLRPEDSQLEGFLGDMQGKISERIKNTPRSDYAEGDTLYTPKGTEVKFISDLSPVRKGANEGLQTAYVELPDGSKSSILLRDLSPEAPQKRTVADREDSPQFRPETNPETEQVAAKYMKTRGVPYTPHTEYDATPESQLKRIADFFQNEAKHDPANPEVRASYDALADETLAQYRAMERAGIKIEPFSGKGEPYKSSADMMADVRDNKHLYFFQTAEAFGEGEQPSENALTEKSGVRINGTELLFNDLFRAVHDYFGHTAQGFEFGPRGEFNAWKSHSKMFSDEAQGALAAETLAQNAWVNFGPHMRNKDGAVPKKGEEGFISPQDRPFAEQKNFVLPSEYLQFRPDTAQATRQKDGAANLNDISDLEYTVKAKGKAPVQVKMGERYADQMNYEEALPLQFQIENGKVVTDKKGPKVLSRDYDFYDSPVVSALNLDPDVLGSLKTKLNTTTLSKVKNGFLETGLNDAEKNALKSMVNAYADRAISDFNRYAKDPEVKAAAGWYSDVSDFFKKLIPEVGDRTKFLEFLGGTSPNTSVEQNFLYALDLFNRWKKGELNGVLDAYKNVQTNFDSLASEYADKNPVLLKSGAQKTQLGQPVFQWEAKPEGIAKFKEEYAKVLVGDGFTPKEAQAEANKGFSEDALWNLLNLKHGVKLERAGEGGGKYGVHTDRIFQILDGVWREQTDAPKAPNFTENLAGLSTRATIDVWAARWLRRLGHDGMASQWRILPMAESGVANFDFFLGQEIFAETTKRINEKFSGDLGRTIGADDLQAIMWFAEKREWKNRGWSKSEDLGDFRQYAYKLQPKTDGTFSMNGVTLNSTSLDFLKTLSGVEIQDATLSSVQRKASEKMREAVTSMRQQAEKGDKLSSSMMAKAEEKFLAAKQERGQKLSTNDYRE